MSRCAEPPNEMPPINSIEISFGIPVYMTDQDYRALDYVVHEIVRNPCNQMMSGVHWRSGSGQKPSFSQADCAFLGKPVDPNTPASGEPTFDASVHFIETTAREFVSDKERDRVLHSRRQSPKARPPSPYPTWLDAAVSSFPNTNLSLPEHVSFEAAESGARDELKRLRDQVKKGEEARDLLRMASSGEYRIVSSVDLTALQIAEARSLGRYFVDSGNSLGWALLPWHLRTEKDKARDGAKTE